MKIPPRPKLIKEKDGVRGLVPVGPDSHKDVEYTKYLEALDFANNDPLRQSLAASTDIRFTEFFRRMSMPKNRVSLVCLAKGCSIDLAEMMNWVSKANNARAMAIFQSASPKIAEHMSIDAESRMVGCERCDGLGFVNADEGLPIDTAGYRILRTITDDEGREQDIWIRDCPAGCNRGKVRQAGDEFSREKTLEAIGMINKKGAGIQITQNFGGQSMPSAVSRLDVMTIDVEAE